MKQTKILNLRFNCDNGKKYSVRVRNANANVSSDQVRRAVDLLVHFKTFDFDGKGSAYQLANATYTTTDQTALVSNK